MQNRRQQDPRVREFILRNVADHPGDIASLAANEFDLKRATINRYTRRLIDDGLLTATGSTRARRYELRNIVDFEFRMEGITRSPDEDLVWRFKVLPEIRDLPKNIVDILHYGFTEIYNNVIDHSLSDDVIISYQQNYCTVSIYVIDHGIGIFEKIQKDFDLADPRSALLELAKGKLTSDKTRHTGWGIYFTSRMFDRFRILSGALFYLRRRRYDHDSFVDAGDIDEPAKGTIVSMEISTDAKWTTREIFDQDQGEGLGFRKTHVPVKLGLYPGEQLVSRSQAKRVLARFDEFSEVCLDFNDVEDIGQPFADEIFRVFRNAHPEIKFATVGANANVAKMIACVTESAREENTRT